MGRLLHRHDNSRGEPRRGERDDGGARAGERGAERARTTRRGHDVGETASLGKLGVAVASVMPLDVHPDVMIDFSIPDGTMAILKTCVDRKIPLVVATTGFTASFVPTASSAKASFFGSPPKVSLPALNSGIQYGSSSRTVSHRA